MSIEPPVIAWKFPAPVNSPQQSIPSAQIWIPKYRLLIGEPKALSFLEQSPISQNDLKQATKCSLSSALAGRIFSCAITHTEAKIAQLLLFRELSSSSFPPNEQTLPAFHSISTEIYIPSLRLIVHESEGFHQTKIVSFHTADKSPEIQIPLCQKTEILKILKMRNQAKKERDELFQELNQKKIFVIRQKAAATPPPPKTQIHKTPLPLLALLVAFCFTLYFTLALNNPNLGENHDH